MPPAPLACDVLPVQHIVKSTVLPMREEGVEIGKRIEGGTDPEQPFE